MNEESLIAAALEKATAAERQAFLDEACSGNAALRLRVERSLAADEQASGILERGPDGAARNTCDLQAPLAADRLFAGRFKLRQKLGEGGMGEVWVADQTEPVQRRVALKVIRPGLDSARLLARFDQERQALALMDHPNIAKVLDAGVTDGRPFFVMDLIKGIAITKYCDAAKLSPKARLELFIPVCHAVQHAHQKGIIHRDLKPSNILVALYDGQAVPKVIDFGVAKATGPRLSEQSVYTEVGTLVGTLEYMSPEQAELNNLDIDTRSDIYALGAVLYELLTGSLPFSRKELQSAAFAEMLRIIKEVEPPRPSTRLSGSETLPSVAAVRQMEPKKLTALVRGELDWIVMKALEKDRNRRYATASGFAADVQRYLHDEPVHACPPSTGYRLWKFGRRNKGPVLAASLVVLALVGGIVGTTVGLVHAEQARKDAVAAQEAEVGQRRTADEERAVALAVNDFVQKDLLGQADLENQPGGAGMDVPRDPDIKVRTVLDRAAKTIGGRFANQPRVEAAIRLTIANAYHALGHYKEAQLHGERSVALRTAHLGADHADTLTSKDALSGAYYAQGFHERSDALSHEVLEKRTATLGPDHPDTLTSMEGMAGFYVDRRKYDLAEPLLRQIVQGREAQLGAHDLATLQSKHNFAWLLRLQLKYDLAERQYIDLIKAYESTFGKDHPGTLLSKSNLGLVYAEQRNYAQAEPLLREVLQKRTALQGPSHPYTQWSMVILGSVYRAARKYELAVPMLEEAVEAIKASQGEDHPSTLRAMQHLAWAYRDWGKLELALPLFEHVLAKFTEKPPPDDDQTVNARNDLARSYVVLNTPEKAIPLFEQTLAKYQEILPPGHNQTLSTMNGLASAYLAAKMPEKAMPLYVQTLPKQREQLGSDHPRTLAAMDGLAKALLESKQPDKALPLFREHVDRQRKRLGAESEPFAALLAQNCKVLLHYKQYLEAEKHSRECLAIRENKAPDDWRTFNTRSILGEALLGQEKYADAGPLLLSGYEGMKQREAKIPGQFQHVRLAEALERLVQLCVATDKSGEAAKWRKELEAVKAAVKSPAKP